MDDLKRAFELIENEWWWFESALGWPDDVEGQRRYIGPLIRMATTLEFPYQLRVWAFDKLHEIARDYDDPDSVPPELTAWGFGVWTGKIKPPKRPRKRPSVDMDILKTEDIQKTVKFRVIGAIVSSLQEHDNDREAAIKRVAEAAELTLGRVKKILEILEKSASEPKE